MAGKKNPNLGDKLRQEREGAENTLRDSRSKTADSSTGDGGKKKAEHRRQIRHEADLAKMRSKKLKSEQEVKAKKNAAASGKKGGKPKKTGNLAADALSAKTQYQGALRLFPVPESGWRPKVYTCSAYTKTGLEEVWKGVEEFLDFIQANGYFTHNRNRQNKYWMYETIDEVLKNSFYHNPQIEPRITELEQKVLDAKVSSFVAAHELLELYFKNKN